jgi:hypothetical protein
VGKIASNNIGNALQNHKLLLHTININNNNIIITTKMWCAVFHYRDVAKQHLSMMRAQTTIITHVTLFGISNKQQASAKNMSIMTSTTYYDYRSL